MSCRSSGRKSDEVVVLQQVSGRQKVGRTEVAEDGLVGLLVRKEAARKTDSFSLHRQMFYGFSSSFRPSESSSSFRRVGNTETGAAHRCSPKRPTLWSAWWTAKCRSRHCRTETNTITHRRAAILLFDFHSDQMRQSISRIWTPVRCYSLSPRFSPQIVSVSCPVWRALKQAVGQLTGRRELFFGWSV